MSDLKNEEMRKNYEYQLSQRDKDNIKVVQKLQDYCCDLESMLEESVNLLYS